MTLTELITYPKFLFRNGYPTSKVVDELINTVMQYENQFDIYLSETKCMLVFKHKKSDFLYRFWIANRFYGFLCNIDICKKDEFTKLYSYTNCFPKRITAVRFWLRYKNIILEDDILLKKRNEKRDNAVWNLIDSFEKNEW